MRSPASAVRGCGAAAAVACFAALVAACGSPSSPAAPPAATSSASPTGPATPTGATAPAGSPSTVPASPGASAAAAPAGPPPCPASALKVAVPTDHGSAAAGSVYYPVQFTNSSGSSCTLFGYPGVSFVTGVGGSQIGIPATENPAHSRQLVTLAPGQTAHAVLQVVDAQNYPAAACGVVSAHWLKIYPPNQTAPLYVSFAMQTCSKPKTILTVETVQPGSTGT